MPDDERRPDVIMLPGGVLPASLAYEALLKEFGDDVHAVAKELDVYGNDRPPPGYTLDVEVAGIVRCAEEVGFDRFHLVGYSGGGASSLAFAAAHPGRLKSLALLEPAWAGNKDLSPEEAALWAEFRRIAELPPNEMMPAFVAAQLRPGVEPPSQPPGPPPPWMSSRPAGLRAFIQAFTSGDLDLGALRSFKQPVYFALGGLSNPDCYERMADRLSDVFSDFTLEVFERRHHFDPPHRIEPERVAFSLRAIWDRAEELAR
ncbi:MAG: alpha/beta fold hydrolase [Solirubrobacterales bacterium]